MALTFSRFDFIATEVFLCLFVDLVLARDRVVLLQRKLLGGRLCVLHGIVSPVSRRFRHETDQLPLGILLICHN